MDKLGFLYALLVAGLIAAIAIVAVSDSAGAHGSCRTHHSCQTTDGSHDRDRDGIGCESLPKCVTRTTRPRTTPPPKVRTTVVSTEKPAQEEKAVTASLAPVAWRGGWGDV